MARDSRKCECLRELVENIAAALAHFSVVRVAAQLTMVPAARALRLAGCGNLDLRLFDIACDNVDVAHNEEFFEVGRIMCA